MRELRPAGSQHRWRHYRAVLDSGRAVFVKAAQEDLGGLFDAEARGLAWLGQAGQVPVPEVIGWDDATLVVSWVPAGEPSRDAAERFGRGLAGLHAAGAGGPGPAGRDGISGGQRPPGAQGGRSEPAAGGPGAPGQGGTGPRGGHNCQGSPAGQGGRARSGDGEGWRGMFGAPWPGFIASLPLPNDPGESWPDWYAQRRLAPYLRRAADAGVLSGGDVRLVEAVMARIADLAGPAEPPARIHGDLWAGNLLWSGGQGWLIDPAAHAGHRETDLAMLALFGAAYLEPIFAAYNSVAPLADGWQARVPLHQLHPLLVHVCLFGGAYREQALAAARAALAAG